MLQTLLLTSALSLAAGDEATLHPAESNVFLSVPDLPAAMDAYQDAPIVRLLRDPELNAFVANLAQEDPETFDMLGFARMSLEQELMSAPPEVAAIVDIVSDATSFSASVSGLSFDGLAAFAAPNEEGALALVSELGARVGATISVRFVTEEGARGADELFANIPVLVPLEGSGEPIAAELPQVRVRRYRFDGPELLPLVWTTVVGDRLVVGLGTSTPEGLAERLTDPSASLAGSERFLAAGRHFAAEGGVLLDEFYLRVGGFSELLATFRELAPDQPALAMVAQLMPLVMPGDAVELRERTRMVDGRFESEVFHNEEKCTGLAACSAQRPVGQGAYALLPPEATAVYVSTIEPAAMRRVLETLLATPVGEECRAMLDALATEHDLHPMDDLFGSIGSDFAYYTNGAAGISLPQMHVAFELTDPAAFERGVETLASVLEEVAGDQVKVRSKPYRKVPVTTVSLTKDFAELARDSGGGQAAMQIPVNVNPDLTIAVLDDRAVFSIRSTYVRKEIKRLQEDDPRQHPIVGIASQVPDGAVGIGWSDWASFFAGLYDGVRAFLPFIAGQFGGDMPFDPSDLPDSELITRYFEPTVQWTQRVEGGTYTHSVSSFGPEVPAVLAGSFLGGVATALRFSPAMSSMQRKATAIEESRSPERETEQVLRSVKIGLVVFKNARGGYPDELRELLEPTDAFPKGFLDGSRLPADGWGRPLRYAPHGDTFELWSVGPDGVDQGGAGDDVPTP